MLENEQLDEFKDYTDTQLIHLYQLGNQTAFQQLAVRYLFLIRTQVSEFKHRELEHDDLFQEALLGFHNAVNSYNPNSSASFGTYAKVCVHNKLLSALRSVSANKNQLNVNTLPIDEISDVPLSENLQPENAVILHEDWQTMMNFIEDRLSPTELKVLSHYLDGMSYEQIAQTLGISVKSCDNAMQRVRSKLKIKS